MGELRRGALALATGPMVELTDGTGGTLVHNTNDLNAGLRQLAEGAEYTYVLELSLDSAKLDGRYHRLRVGVNREGLQLETRQGYFLPKPAKKK